ncbi:MAG: radical SAM protein [Anaerolineae bacterium]|nr:radical SAM protein [Anaerolineae bacterium]
MSWRHLPNLLQDRLTTLPILILYLTDGCNSRCITCDIWRNPRLNMRRELVDHLASEVEALGVRWVVLSGGEAMQHPHWPQIAAQFRDKGVRTILLTNGLLLRRQASDVIAHVDEVVVSLDAGTAATYEAIRGVDGFELLLDGIRAVRAGGVPVTTRTTIQRLNYAELPQIIDAAKDVGVNSISFLTVDVSNPYAFGDRLIATLGPGAPDDHGPPSDALTRDDIPQFAAILNRVERDYAEDFSSGRMAESPAKLRRMVDYFQGVLNGDGFPSVRCNAPHLSAVVQVDGSLRPCYFLPVMARAGSDKTAAPHVAPLREAINAPDALALRRAYRSGQRPECARCVCPLYKGPRALMRL